MSCPARSARLGSVRLLKAEADRIGIVTKRRQLNGQNSGGKPLTRGNLYQILSNALYIGRIPHKGETYPGQHEPIISDDLWAAVQDRRAKNDVDRRSDTNVRAPALLSGLLFDEAGHRPGPTHTSKNGRRYRYYVSNGNEGNQDGWRLPAEDFERVLTDLLSDTVQDPRDRHHRSARTRGPPPVVGRRRMSEVAVHACEKNRT